ncbi:MAG: carcinine hydrolase/isopenicillin-N N-acyltransferase family protein, partial [Candidatus Thorarchaeota archaeon]
MCDTLIALGNTTLEGHVIFGKNSDRPSSEAQLITYTPATHHSKEEEVKCTYITIPQASETYATIMSQPFWMFGCEIGCNENGVVIGNEAVHTKEPLRSSGLLGMDLLRLGLERAKSAKDAVDVITSLLETYGQGGNCSFTPPEWLYHNSYI